MNEEPFKAKKKFKGFTALFQNQGKTNVKKEKPKKPFTGFSEFYKKIKEHEIFDEEDDYDSLYDPVPRRDRQKIPEKIEEPPPPEDKHFKPQKYFEWCKGRTKEAFRRCAEEQGVGSVCNEEGRENDGAESVKSNPLVREIKKLAYYRKYDNQRMNYDRSIRDNLSHVDDINPWHHNTFNKLGKEDNISGENQVRLEVPNLSVDSGLRNIYSKLNARETLQFDEMIPRKINTYPYEFQFKNLNIRMKKFLKHAKRNPNDDDDSDDASSRGSEKSCKMDPHTGLIYERKELEDYFNRLTKPKREINFRPEDFKSWYSKMSFNFDRRFKYNDKMNMTPECEDFTTWLNKRTENMDKKLNNELSIPTLSQIKQIYKMKNITLKERKFNVDYDLLSELSKPNGSVSNLSNCRSLVDKLQ